jgi:hypothetical protein
MKTYTKKDVEKLREKADLFKAYATYEDFTNLLDFIEENGLVKEDAPELLKTFVVKDIHYCPWCHVSYDYDKGHDCLYWNKHMQDSCI